jgi:membrane protease YdiL (CAAX protease family)
MEFNSKEKSMKKLFVDQKGRVRSGYLLVIGYAVMILCSLAAFSVQELLKALEVGDSVTSVIFGVVYGGVSFILCYFIFRFLFKNQPHPAIDCYKPSGKTFANLGGGLLFGLLAFSLVVLPLYLTGQYTIAFHTVDLMELLSTFIYFIAIGLVEELVVRGIMQHGLFRFGIWPSLIIMSIIFGAMHLTNPGGFTVMTLLGVSLAGVILGVSMYVTHSISFAIGFHITWNWVQGSIYGIPVSGGAASPGSLFTTTFVGQNELITGGTFGTEASLSCTIVLLLLILGFILYGVKSGRLASFAQSVKMLEALPKTEGTQKV